MKHFSCLFPLLPMVLLACSEPDAGPPADDSRLLLVEVEPSVRAHDGLAATDTADGWAIRFEHAYVMFGEVLLEGPDRPQQRIDGAFLVDALGGDSRELGMRDVPLGSWPSVSFRTVRLDAGYRSGNVYDDAESDAFTAAKAVVRLVGSAERDGRTLRFDWSFEQPTTYTMCHREGDPQPGITVMAPLEEPLAGDTDGRTRALRVALTVRPERLFLDELTSPIAAYRFATYAAADTDDDGVLTRAELAALPRSAFVGGSYATGATAEATTLEQYAQVALRDLVGFDGDGPCSH